MVKSGGEWINPETGELEPKLHDYYRLKIPARDPETLKKLKQARELATEIVGGDASNVSAVHPIRWPGSLHRKEEPKLCCIMTINAEAEIDLDQALDILRKARPHSGNGHDANAPDYNPYDRYEVEERLDLDQLLDDMVFYGTGNGGNVNTTELRYCSSQLSRGMSVNEVIETLRNEILNRIPESHNWDWSGETETLQRMCTDWLRKHPELEETTYPPPESDQAKPDTRQMPAVALFDPWAQFIVPTFPLEVLPPSLLTYVIAQAEVIGVDVSSMAMTILAACSSALSHCFALKMMRHGNWYVSPRLWVLLFGDSSKKKTPTILAATKPLKDYQDETWAEYEREKNYASIMEKDPPPPPVRYVVYDSTIEKLADLLSRSERGILLKRDELAGWLGGMEKYGGSSHGANSDRGHYLELYDGGGRVVDRVKRGEAFIKNFSASFIGGIQPKKLVELRGLTSDGLLQRFLPNVMTETTFRKDEPCDEKAYDALLRQLLEAEPNVLTLSDEALEVMETLHRYLYDLEKHAGGLPEGFDAFVGKLAGVSGNLALVLHMVSDPKNGAKKPVTAATVKDVQKLIMEFILPHALEFYECVEGATTGSHRMRKLASWILTRGKERFVSSDLTSNIADFRGLKEWDLNQYVSPLVAAGWITPTDKGPLHKAWKVSPNVFTQFTERAKQEEASKQALAKLMNSPRKEKI